MEPLNDLKTEGRRVWDELYSKLTDAGVLTSSDLNAFVMLCESFDNVKRCDEELRQTGEYYTAPKGQILRHPQAVQRDKYVAERSALMRQFGLMPLARGTMKGVEEKPVKVTGLEQNVHLSLAHVPIARTF
jgi:P27 family predicted phage terminase small subunit